MEIRGIAKPAPDEPEAPRGDWRTHAPAPLVRLLVGVPFAVALNFLVCNLGWALKAFPHECGHAIAGWLMGYVSIPTVTFTYTLFRIAPLCLAIWGGMGYLAWRARKDHLPLAVALAVAAVLYPFVAFTDTKEVFILWAGHGGESCFAAFFFWRALAGRLRAQDDPPPVYSYAYSTLGWSAFGYDLNLFFGLITSPEARYKYELLTFGREEGTNDYSRIAGLLGWKVERAAATLGIGPALVLPLAGIALWWFTSRRDLWRDPVPLPAPLRRA